MIPDFERPDLETQARLIAQLKVAPPQEIPQHSVEKIKAWPAVPSPKDVQCIISAGGCSTTAKRVLLEVRTISEQVQKETK